MKSLSFTAVIVLLVLLFAGGFWLIENIEGLVSYLFACVCFATGAIIIISKFYDDDSNSPPSNPAI